MRYWVQRAARENEPVKRGRYSLSQNPGRRPLQESFLGTRTPGTHEGAQFGRRWKACVSGSASAFYHAQTVHWVGEGGGVVFHFAAAGAGQGAGQSRTAGAHGIAARREDARGGGPWLFVPGCDVAPGHAPE